MSDPNSQDGIAAGNGDDIMDGVLETAALYNNLGFVSDWLMSFTKEETDKEVYAKRRGSVLRRACYYHSVDVVNCIAQPGHCDDIINLADSDGKTPLHQAAEGSQRIDMDPVKTENDLLNIMGYLFKNGADPTVKYKNKTPKDIATEHGFKLGTALLETLECIWNKTYTHDKNIAHSSPSLHKQLLVWAVEREYVDIARSVLVMNITALDDQGLHAQVVQHPVPISLKDCTVMQFLMGTAEGLGVKTLIHVAANLGNPELLKTLLVFSGLPLNVVINKRWNTILQPMEVKENTVVVKEDEIPGQTPLSLVLSHPSHYNIIKDVFVKLQQSKNDLVSHVDLSCTMTNRLPKELFHLKSVYSLNVSNNQIASLPFAELSTQLRPGMLKDLNLSRNSLQNLPIEVFRLPNLNNFDVSHNPLTCLPELWWMSDSLVKFNASSTSISNICAFGRVEQANISRMMSMPSSSRQLRGVRASSPNVNGCPLQELNVSACNLHSFPTYLACFFPNLRHLNMSGNKITSCCSINELPALLEELDLSHNELQSEFIAIFSVYDDFKNFRCYYDADIECSMRCTHMSHKQLSKLRTLNLSDNSDLQNVLLHHDNLTASSAKTADVFFPKLGKLILRNCGLKQAPEHLGRMSRIHLLDISYNEMSIPREVYKLESLSTFDYTGVKDSVVIDLDNFISIRDQQMFLMQENSQPAASLKLMFVGRSGRGKTTLLYHLKYRKSKPITFRERLNSSNHTGEYNSGNHTDEIQSTIGIDQDLWCYSKGMDNDAASSDGITFFAWDFAGEEEYSAAHQCFITENSLYVLCWRVTDGEDGIQELKDWLVTIKARTKSAMVVIVGTHIDKVRHFNKQKRIPYTKRIEELYSSRYWYPTIKAIEFVSCDVKYKKYNKYLKPLRDTLYDIASSMKMSVVTGNKRFEQEVINIRIPVKYRELQDRIIAEATYYRRHRQKRPPILSWDEICKLGNQCGFKEESELIVAIKYIQGQGTLMHFDSFALKDLYFIDSQWLCDVFAHVVSPKCNDNLAHNGIAERRRLEESLAETYKITEEAMEPIVALLSKFELAIPLDRNTFLIPSLLTEQKQQFSGGMHCFPRRMTEPKSPLKKTSCPSLPVQPPTENKAATNNLELPPVRKQRANTGYFLSVVTQHSVEKEVELHSTGMCFRRIFTTHHVPANFWPRVIARFLASAESFYKTIANNCCPEIQPESYVGVGGATIGALMCTWYYGKSSIELMLGDDLVLCVNALFKNVSNKTAISNSVDKVRNMQIYCDVDRFAQANVSDGFEVSVPDYVVTSCTTSGGEVYHSNLMGAQMLSRALETIDEVFKEWFEGLLEQGIYSDDNLCHFIPCPYCYGDTKPPTVDKDEERLMTQSFISRQPDVVTGGDPVGFSVQHCLFQGRKCIYIKCPHHGDLALKYLTPDLMFEDKKFKKIDESLLDMDSQPLGEGGFGAVYKSRYRTTSTLNISQQDTPPQEVAVKRFVDSPKDMSPQDLAQKYADVRLEFNKIESVDHPNIVKCFGFCVTTLSFVLELAPLGSLKSIMKTYSSSGYHVCPSSVVDTFKQVSLALDYLHTKEMIVHYDIKPDNILVFSFPQAGHDCFDDTNNMVCSACQTEDSKVTVKLADLGVSAFVGPAGFRRRPGTKGHTAPEALRCAGKEALGEKVDIFSLGITMYELMTLQTLPPKNTVDDFDSDIKDGMRPDFLEEGPKYPIILKELVVNCWAQEYAARPTAQEIVSILQSPDCLKLTNTYNTELPYSVVSAALVVTVEDQQSLWLAHTTDYKYKVTIYEFTDPEESTDICMPVKDIIVKKPVQAMCQVKDCVWMLLESGALAAVHSAKYIIGHEITKPEFDERDLARMITVHDHAGLFALAYQSGLLVFVTSCLTFSLDENAELQSFGRDILDEVSTQQEQIKVSSLEVSSFRLCTIEACRKRNGNQVEVWCGCDGGVLEICTPPDGVTKATLKSEINTYENSTDISPNSNITKLKCHYLSDNGANLVFALHGSGGVISCWSVGDSPTLTIVIKPSHLTSPVTTILPLGGILNIVDKSGKVYQLNLNDAITQNDFSCKLLPNPYQSSMIVNLFGLQGEMSTKGFVSSVGGYPEEHIDDQVVTEEDSSYVNVTMRPPSGLPCVVLLASGYTVQTDNPLVYFTTWTSF